MSAERRKVFVVVSIDTECDKGPGWKTQFPLCFRSVTDGIPKIFTPLFRKHELVPTYLVSPEILQDAACVAVLRGVQNAELGTHLHGEFIEPEADRDAPVTSTPQTAYAPEVERQKLKNLTDLFVSAIGRRPLSFRAGRFALGPRSLPFLEELGYRVDSSVTPFRTNEYPGGLTSNYWGAPLAPYHPCAADPRRKGGLRLLEVPVTILAPAVARWPSFLLRRMSDRTARSRPMKMILGGPLETLWVRPLRGTGEQLAAWADAVVASWDSSSTPVLNVMFHSVEVIAAASPYTQTDQEVRGLLSGLEHLFEHLRARYRVAPVGLAGLCEGLEA